MGTILSNKPGESCRIPRRGDGLFDMIGEEELRLAQLDVVEGDEHPIEGQRLGVGRVFLPSLPEVKGRVEMAGGYLPGQRQPLVELLRHLLEREDVGAEAHALALVAVDGGGDVGDGDADAGDGDGVAAGGVVGDADQPRLLAVPEPEVDGQVAPLPHRLHGGACGLPRPIQRLAPHRLTLSGGGTLLASRFWVISVSPSLSASLCFRPARVSWSCAKARKERLQKSRREERVQPPPLSMYQSQQSQYQTLKCGGKQ